MMYNVIELFVVQFEHSIKFMEDSWSFIKRDRILCYFKQSARNNVKFIKEKYV